MIGISQLLDLACRVGGPRFAHDIRLRRLERWRNFELEYFLLDHLVDPQRAAIDVGANEGIYAGRLSQLCSRVHCFEPIPWFAKRLRECLRPAVATVHEAAASDHNGQGELRIPYCGEVEMHGTSTIEPGNPLSESTHARAVPCRLVRLDDTVVEPVGFIKVDVEGHEFAVLEGAKQIISRDRPILLIESEKRHNQTAPENIFAFAAELGYAGFFLEHGRLWALSAFSAATHQNPQNLAGGTRKTGIYVNNFIFVPGFLPSGVSESNDSIPLKQ